MAIAEGPHDVAAYAAVDRLRLPAALPVSAFGVRIVCATGGDGGITVIPHVAELGRDLGFRVIALIDHDKPHHQSGTELKAVVNARDVVIRLPEKVAIEKAVLYGVPMDTVRAATAAVTDLLGISDPADGKADDTALNAVVSALHSSSFHEQLVDAAIDRRYTALRRGSDLAADFRELAYSLYAQPDDDAARRVYAAAFGQWPAVHAVVGTVVALSTPARSK
ncbi:hypothetical protein [Actinoplanes sp. NPDC051411]|uniref:hypothetical protein n=1 Tax=Actinoplanes sp. NPDC051411 TaxID=3155522 RepID=UPI00342B50B0